MIQCESEGAVGARLILFVTMGHLLLADRAAGSRARVGSAGARARKGRASSSTTSRQISCSSPSGRAPSATARGCCPFLLASRTTTSRSASHWSQSTSTTPKPGTRRSRASSRARSGRTTSCSPESSRWRAGSLPRGRRSTFSVPTGASSPGTSGRSRKGHLRQDIGAAMGALSQWCGGERRPSPRAGQYRAPARPAARLGGGASPALAAMA